MSAFKPSRVDPVQIDSLVSDPELATAEGILAAAIATRASQVSVNNLGATLGPAIVNATADKATSAELADAVTAIDAATVAARDVLTGNITAAGATVNTHVDSSVAPLATSAGLAGAVNTIATGVSSAQSAINTHTDTATAPLATSMGLAGAVSTISANVSAAQAAVNGHGDTNTALVTAALTAAQTAITAHDDGNAVVINSHTDTATAPLATSMGLAGAVSTISANVSAAQAAVNGHGDTNTALVTAALTAAQTAITAHDDGNTTAINSHTDAATAPLATATALTTLATALGTNVATLLSAIAAAGTRSGQVSSFLASAVPADHTKLTGTDFIPSGGVVEASIASSQGLGSGDCAYVSTGANSGLWRYRKDRWQRIDINTNTLAGSEYLCPTTISTSIGPTVACEVIGSKIYYAGIATGAAPTATAKLYVFDTNTLAHTGLADFPRALLTSGCMRSVLLADGITILFTSPSAVGLTVTPAATPFWLYNTVTNATPTEVIVNLPITKFLSGADTLMQPLPGGKILCVDGTAPAAGNVLSCTLTISGSTITPSAAADTGLVSIITTANAWFIPTSSGALLSSSAIVKGYLEGSGWSAVSAAPNAYGSMTWGLRGRRMGNFGWMLISGQSYASGQLQVSLFMTGAAPAGSVAVQASKN